MLLKSGANPFKKAPAPQENGVKGIYMTKDMRIETKKEITRAHFDLGHKDLSKSVLDVKIYRIPRTVILSFALC